MKIQTDIDPSYHKPLPIPLAQWSDASPWSSSMDNLRFQETAQFYNVTDGVMEGSLTTTDLRELVTLRAWHQFMTMYAECLDAFEDTLDGDAASSSPHASQLLSVFTATFDLSMQELVNRFHNAKKQGWNMTPDRKNNLWQNVSETYVGTAYPQWLTDQLLLLGEEEEEEEPETTTFEKLKEQEKNKRTRSMTFELE